MKVKKETLILIAGIVWLIAGVNVARIGLMAYRGYVSVVHSVLSAMVFLVFGIMFFKMSEKHIKRILSYTEETYFVYRFFDLKSYCIMGFMMTGGIWLRYSNLVPILFIAIFYTGLGVALAFAGILFTREYVKIKRA